MVTPAGGAAAWVSASVTALGVAVFLMMSEPKGGHQEATPAAWLPALLTLAASPPLYPPAGRGSPVRRAASICHGVGDRVGGAGDVP